MIDYTRYIDFLPASLDSYPVILFNRQNTMPTYLRLMLVGVFPVRLYFGDNHSAASTNRLSIVFKTLCDFHTKICGILSAKT
jgi:hypothetical protein